MVTVERELMPDFRLSGIASFRRERRQVGLKDVTSTFLPVTIQDPDTGNDITVFNKTIGSFGAEQFRVTNSEQLDQSFRGFEVIANKRLSNRWEMLGPYSISRAVQEQVTLDGDIFGIDPLSVDPNNGVNARGRSSGIAPIS